MKNKLKSIIEHLKKRRGMYIANKDCYSSLVSFLTGFSVGIKNDEEENIFVDFHKWLELREKKNFSVLWSFYILNELCMGDEKKAIEHSLNLIFEFTKDNGYDNDSYVSR